MIIDICLYAYGTRLFTTKKLPIDMNTATMISGFMIRMSDMPADFIASNS